MSREAWLSASAVVSVGATIYYLWRSSQSTASAFILQHAKRPAEVTWLDDATFEVLTAICDTFLPSVREEEITIAAIESALENAFPGIFNATSTDHLNRPCRSFVKLSEAELSSMRSPHFKRGALESGIHTVIAKTFQYVLSEKEKKQIYFFLKALSTTPGCLLLTGHAAPFQTLPIESRAVALGKFRDSSLQDLRTAYQVRDRQTDRLREGGREGARDAVKSF